MVRATPVATPPPRPALRVPQRPQRPRYHRRGIRHRGHTLHFEGPWLLDFWAYRDSDCSVVPRTT